MSVSIALNFEKVFCSCFFSGTLRFVNAEFIPEKGIFMNYDNDNFDTESEKQEQSAQDQETLNEAFEHDPALKCLAELSMWQDQCKRISAEFENFKRRVDRDKIRWSEIAKESILLELLSFCDTFETALQQKDGVDHAGIEMVYQSLMKLLAKHDVTVMQTTKKFDPEFHEAVMQVPSKDHKSGEIVNVLTKGFMIKDRVLRPAKVCVAD
ncbi:nucleotide exchange factor GrpE [candidate division TM6 bacterium RIFCSPHIGHO2_12_FULL_38_8]|nr:MAG: nucleotide exchange factor GrpE [candidate division TM6 bacterium RIFCSPHIGHO2_12_FULL_38_8]